MKKKSQAEIAFEITILIAYLTSFPIVVWWIASFRAPSPMPLALGCVAAAFSIGLAPSMIRGALANDDLTGAVKKLGLRYIGDRGQVGAFGLTRFPFVDHPDFPVAHFSHGTWNGIAVAQFLSGFTLRYDTGNYWINIAQMPASMPPVEIMPRGYVGRREDIGDDIFFESTDFTARWRVMCPDVRYAHAVVHPRMMERLLNLGDNGFPVTLDGDKVFTWARQESAKEADIAARFSLLRDVVALIPPHVWREYGRPVGSVTPGAGAGAPGTARSFLVPVRDKNLWGRVAVLLSLTWILAPIGILVGYSAKRNVKKGLASNLKTAQAGIVLGYFFTALVIASVVAAILYP